MDPSRVNRILDDWSAVASEARRPAAPPHRVVVRGGLSSTTLAGGSLIAVALLVAVVWLGRPGPGPNGLVGSTPSTLPSPSATPVATPSASTIPTPALTPVPTPTPAPTIGLCDPANLPARITLWEGAAGHRTAHLELTNAGSGPCTLTAMARPQLVDGLGSVLIDGTSPSTSRFLTVTPGSVLTTLVQDGNYCGPAPVAPVSVAFVLSGGGRIVATPVSPTDATVPPCLGAAGSAGDIAMQPWVP